MAQRMESAAPSGGSCSVSRPHGSSQTMRCCRNRSLCRSKGFTEPGHELLGLEVATQQTRRRAAKLVGREWELTALTAMLDQSADGQGRIVGIAGAPGIGKSRFAAELAALAQARGLEVQWAVCESHTSDVPFHVVADLLRASSRSGARPCRGPNWCGPNPDADPGCSMTWGIADPTVPLPDIDPDARRRRVTALVWQALLSREIPGVFIIEDVHWVDQVSESMLADFGAVIPQSRALAVFTYRPEYQGLLARVPGAQTISLAPLGTSSSTSLITELLATTLSRDRLLGDQRACGRQSALHRGDGPRSRRAGRAHW